MATYYARVVAGTTIRQSTSVEASSAREAKSIIEVASEERQGRWR